MNEAETGRLMRYLKGLYPSLKVDNDADKRAAISAWHYVLADYDAETVSRAIDGYMRGENGAYPPSAPAILSRCIDIEAAARRREQRRERERENAGRATGADADAEALKNIYRSIAALHKRGGEE
jgi:hypothetical protein